VISAIHLQVIISGLLIGAVYALFASGLTLIWGMMNVINFAHGDFVMLAM
jgi:branched-chain amino acid transport system permease protein